MCVDQQGETGAGSSACIELLAPLEKQHADGGVRNLEGHSRPRALRRPEHQVNIISLGVLYELVRCFGSSGGRTLNSAAGPSCLAIV